MHERIDKLFGVSAKAQRKPTDTIPQRLLDWIYKRLETTELIDIRVYRHKFVAHAARPENRKWKDTKDYKISLGKLSQAHKIICETTAFIAENIVCKSIRQFFPHSARDVLENLDKPLATHENMSTLQKQWDRYEKNTKEWCNWDWPQEFSKSGGN